MPVVVVLWISCSVDCDCLSLKPNVSSRTKMSESLVTFNENLTEHLEMQIIRQIIVFKVGRMNVFMIVNILSLSDYIQLIHWCFLYPQKIKILLYLNSKYHLKNYHMGTLEPEKHSEGKTKTKQMTMASENLV